MQDRWDRRYKVLPAIDEKIPRRAIHRDHGALRQAWAESVRGDFQTIGSVGATTDYGDLARVIVRVVRSAVTRIQMVLTVLI